MQRVNFLGDTYLKEPFSVDIELDNFICNLESPLYTTDTPAKNKVNLGVKRPYIIETFKKLPLAVNLANNHIMDFGEEAFLKTIDFLENSKIRYFGAGTEENNFNNPLTITLGEKEIALLGYSCPSTHATFGDKNSHGSASLDEESIIKEIKICKNRYDFVILNLHWGDEEIAYPKPSDVKKARRFIDSGADLIIGHHAHVIQSHEVYKDKYIYYGIGNFIFPDIKEPSYFDGKKFQKVFIKKRSPKNSQTLIINLDKDMSISYNSGYFDGKRVKYKKFKLPRWIPTSQLLYDLNYRLTMKIALIKGFLKNPRVPSMEHLKYFFGVKK
jgi:poly-gamma-glutamate synthesis protein (capsule biosynthesis protein)